MSGYLKGKIGNTPVHKDDTLGYADTECSKSFDLPTPPARKISIPLIPKKTACGANEAYDGDILSDLINLPSSGTDCHRRRKSDNIHIRTRTHTAASSPTTEDQIQSIAPQCNAQICGPDQVQMFPISIAACSSQLSAMMNASSNNGFLYPEGVDCVGAASQLIVNTEEQNLNSISDTVLPMKRSKFKTPKRTSVSSGNCSNGDHVKRAPPKLPESVCTITHIDLSPVKLAADQVVLAPSYSETMVASFLADLTESAVSLSQMKQQNKAMNIQRQNNSKIHTVVSGLGTQMKNSVLCGDNTGAGEVSEQSVLSENQNHLKSIHAPSHQNCPTEKGELKSHIKKDICGIVFNYEGSDERNAHAKNPSSSQSSTTSISNTSSATLSENFEQQKEDNPGAIRSDPSPQTRDQIGFNTARGGNITVSKTSLEAVRGIFDCKDQRDVDRRSDPSPQTRNQLGFNTARGGNITVSKTSLEAVRGIFDCKDQRDVDTGSDPSPQTIDQIGFNTARGGNITVSKTSLEAVRGIFDCKDQRDVDTGSDPSPQTIDQIGFNTARGGNITVSKTSLEAVRGIFDCKDQRDVDTRSDPSPQTRDQLGFNTARGGNITVSKTSLEAVRGIFDCKDQRDVNTRSDPSPQTIDQIGFNTARGGNITVSKTSLEAVRGIFDCKDQIDVDTRSDPSPQTRDQIGFNTARGGNITVSKTSLEAVRGIFDCKDQIDVDTRSDPSPINGDQLGFNTARGVNITVSKSSLEAVRVIFDSKDQIDVDTRSDPSPQTREHIGFNTARGGNITVSKSSLEAVRGIFDSKDQIDVDTRSDPSPQTIDQIGFNTARGGNITVSKTSLEAVRGIFDCKDQRDVDTRSDPSLQTLDQLGFNTARGGNITVSKTSLEAVRGIFDCKDQIDVDTRSDLSPITGDQLGFNTARGGNIAVSKTSLEAVRCIFDCKHQIDVDTRSDPSPQTRDQIGFNTARGGNITVSKTSVEAVKGIFDSKDQIDVDTRSDPSPQTGDQIGFNTARWGNITVSKTSLEAVRGIFDCKDQRDVDTKPDPCPQTRDQIGFNTARGGNITVSKTSLEAVSGIFDSNDEDTRLLPSGIIISNDNNTELIPQVNIQDLQKTTATEQVDNNELQSVFSPINRATSVAHVKTSHADRKAAKRLGGKVPSTPSDSPNRYTLGNKPFKPHTPKRKISALSTSNYVSKVIPPSNSGVVGTMVLQDAVKSVTQTSKLSREGCYSSMFDVMEEKPIHLTKPTHSMMNLKSAFNRYTLRDLGRPSKRLKLQVKVDDEVVNNETAANETAADGVIDWAGGDLLNTSDTQLTQQMINTIQQWCSCRDITPFLTLPMDKRKIYQCFLHMDGVEPRLTTSEWFANHYKWITWKLLSLEELYPQHLGDDILNPVHILKQLKYRYEREIDRNERSAIRKIVEGDDSPSKTMVLMVSKISDVSSKCPSNPAQIEVSDGWYSIKATSDASFVSLIECGKVTVGTKLVICGAQLHGLHQACSPLKVPDSVYLRFGANSCRRARYYSRLGYNNCQMSPSLSSLLPHGGNVCSAVRLVIQTKYPLIYMEKSGDKVIFRNEAKERQLQREETLKTEKLLEQELNKEENGEILSSHVRRRRYTEAEVREVYTGAELLELVNTSVDPDHTQMMMSEVQRERLLSYRQCMTAERSVRIQEKVRESLNKDRQITPLLKLRVAGLHNHDIDNDRAYTLLTVWRPSSDIISLLEEGCVYDMYNLSVSEVKGSYRVTTPVLLSANRSTRYNKITNISQGVLDILYEPRETISVSCMYNQLKNGGWSDVNTAGVVVGWESANPRLAVVYISDRDGAMIALNFWGGLQAHGYDSIVREGVLLHCSNLSSAAGYSIRYTLPCLTVTELSIISSRIPSPSQRGGLGNPYTARLSAIDDECRAALVKSCQASLLRLATSGKKKKRDLQSCSSYHQSEGISSLSTPMSDEGEGYVPSKKAKLRMDKLENVVIEDGDTVTVNPLISTSTRTVLTAAYKNPIVSPIPRSISESEQVTESGDVKDKELDGHVDNKHENVDEEAEEEEDITDSQMMTCFSQC